MGIYLNKGQIKHWCGIIILNVHALSEDKSGGMKDSFYKELVCVFDRFPQVPHQNVIRRFQQKSRERTNEQSGMGVYMKLVMIMVFE
jgi:hypothetical protein